MEEKENEVGSSLVVGSEATLEDLPVGATGIIVSVGGEGRIRRRFFDMGLTPGCEVFVRKRAPLGDPVEVTLRGYELTLRKDEASYAMMKVTDLSKGSEETK